MRPSAPLAPLGRTPPKNRQIYGFFAKTQYGREKSPPARRGGGTERTEFFPFYEYPQSAHPCHTPPSLRNTSPILGLFHTPSPLRGTPSTLEGEFGYSVREAFAETSASKAFLTLPLCRGSTAKRGGGTNPKIGEVSRSDGGVSTEGYGRRSTPQGGGGREYGNRHDTYLLKLCALCVPRPSSVRAEIYFRACAPRFPHVRKFGSVRAEMCRPALPLWGSRRGHPHPLRGGIPAPCPYSKIIPYLCADI